jgi:hypothetical protein
MAAKGAAPKLKLKTTAVTQIVCPPDRHISVEFQEIYAIIKLNLSVAERARFEEVSQLIESLYAQEFMVLRRNLKRNFLCFSMGAKDQAMTTRVGSGLPPAAELDQREEKLVADFMQLMAQARFHILNNVEWELAKQASSAAHRPARPVLHAGGRAHDAWRMVHPGGSCV